MHENANIVPACPDEDLPLPKKINPELIAGGYDYGGEEVTSTITDVTVFSQEIFQTFLGQIGTRGEIEA